MITISNAPNCQQYIYLDDLKIESPFNTSVQQGSATGIIVDLFPNPSTGSVSISGDQLIDEIRVIDATGRLVHYSTPRTDRADLLIDKQGIYTTIVRTHEGIVTKRLVVSQ